MIQCFVIKVLVSICNAFISQFSYRILFQSALAKERRDQKLQAQREQESHSQRSGLSSTARINDPMSELSVQSSGDTSGISQRQKVVLEFTTVVVFL